MLGEKNLLVNLGIRGQRRSLKSNAGLYNLEKKKLRKVMELCQDTFLLLDTHPEKLVVEIKLPLLYILNVANRKSHARISF